MNSEAAEGAEVSDGVLLCEVRSRCLRSTAPGGQSCTSQATASRRLPKTGISRWAKPVISA
jgi:hypothetical protein